MKKTKLLALLLALIAPFLSPVLLQAQEDSTAVKFSTEEVVDESQWNKKIKFKRQGRTVMDDAKGMLSIGVSAFRNGSESLFNGRVNTPVDLTLSYERKILGPAFSVEAELAMRLGGYQHQRYDYTLDEYNNGLLGKEVNGRRQAWLNLGLKYFYNKKTRVQTGRSGNNPFGQYISMQLLSPITLVDESVREFTSLGQVDHILSSVRERTKLGSGPTYLNVSWGIQQRLLKVLTVDANVGIEVGLDEKSYWFSRGAPIINLRLAYLIFQK